MFFSPCGQTTKQTIFFPKTLLYEKENNMLNPFGPIEFWTQMVKEQNMEYDFFFGSFKGTVRMVAEVYMLSILHKAKVQTSFSYLPNFARLTANQVVVWCSHKVQRYISDQRLISNHLV